MSLGVEERAALEASCNERLSTLAQQGCQIAGVQIRFLVELISVLLTADQEAEAKDRWLYWLADALDTAEAELRKRALLMGKIGGNGARRPR